MWDKIHFFFFFFFFLFEEKSLNSKRIELLCAKSWWINLISKKKKKKKNRGGVEEIKRNVENEANEESYEVNVRDLKFGTINFLLRQTGSDGCNSIYESRARGMLFENRPVVRRYFKNYFFCLPFFSIS